MSQSESGSRLPALRVFVRMVSYGVAAILLPPFVMLAVAPLAFVLVPVAICAIPFLLSAFAGEAEDVAARGRRSVRVLRPATMH